MALFHCNFFSETLQLSTAMNVIVPQRPLAKLLSKRPGRSHRYPVLYLLHGLSDDYTIWQRRTSIERYVDPLGLAVVMPAVGRSFYTDMAHGGKYWTFISEEVSAQARAFFPISDRREDNFVAGLSMGGYGAFKLALSHPERYAAAASLSGALDMCAEVKDEDPAWRRELGDIFGDLEKLPGCSNDLFFLVKQVAESGGPRPRLYQWCGTEDFLYEQNVAFHTLAQEQGLDLNYSESPGDHTWGYWDWQIQKVIEWILC